jgi:hypothetical protein
LERRGRSLVAGGNAKALFPRLMARLDARDEGTERSEAGRVNSAIRHLQDSVNLLRDGALSGDAKGRLGDLTFTALKESGGFRLLLAEDLRGFEEHPNEFVDWVIAAGVHPPAAGWVAGRALEELQRLADIVDRDAQT